MLFLIRFIYGYVNVYISGEFAERIINLCTKSGITIWNLKYKKGKIYFSLSIRDFKRLRHIKRGICVKVHIISKSGLPFIIEKNNKRKGIVFGAVLFFLIITYLSSFIWIINVDTGNKANENYVLDVCKIVGIREGIRKHAFSPKNKKDEFLLNTDKYSWASFNVEGSILTVELKAAKNIDITDTPSNLISSGEGIIKKLDVKSGTSVVKVGDAVAKGDLLVSGIVENINSTSYVKSKGTIIAEVTESYTLFEKYEQIKNINVKKAKTFNLIKAYNVYLPIYYFNEPKNCICKTHFKNCCLLGKKIPIKIYSKDYYKFEKKKMMYNKDFIYNDLEKKLKNKVSEKYGDFNIISLDFIDETDGVKAVITIRTQKNIAKTDKLLINSGKY